MRAKINPAGAAVVALVIASSALGLAASNAGTRAHAPASVVTIAPCQMVSAP